MCQRLENREFRYHVPWYWLLILVLGASCLAFLAASFISVSLSLLSIEAEVSGVDGWSPRRAAIEMIIPISLAILNALLVVFVAVRSIFLMKNASIRVDDRGMTRTDWLGRHAFLAWSDVCEVMIPLGGRLSSPPVKVTVGDRSVRIPRHWLRDRGMLVDEILHRSAVQRVSGNWFRDVYRRPG